jgi:hypothetical protein
VQLFLDFRPAFNRELVSGKNPRKSNNTFKRVSSMKPHKIKRSGVAVDEGTVF